MYPSKHDGHLSTFGFNGEWICESIHSWKTKYLIFSADWESIGRAKSVTWHWRSTLFIKSLHAQCLVDCYKHMTIKTAQNVIYDGWKAAWITEELHIEGNPFQPSVAFHIETRNLFCRANQMTGFYMKHNTGLKWVNGLESLDPFQDIDQMTEQRQEINQCVNYVFNATENERWLLKMKICWEWQISLNSGLTQNGKTRME